MATEFEEVLIGADALELEKLAPDGGERSFVRRCRRPVRDARVEVCVRQVQGRFVDLAVRVERKRIEPDDARRQHVRRKRVAQRRADIGCIGVASGCAHDVSDECIARDDDRRRDCGMSQQRRFHLGEFDAKATQLDLPIGASEIFHVAIRTKTCEVARAIEPAARLRAEPVGNESLRSEIRLVQVASRDAGTAEVEFPCDTDGDRLQVRVEHVRLSIRDRTTDGQPPTIGFVRDAR